MDNLRERNERLTESYRNNRAILEVDLDYLENRIGDIYEPEIPSHDGYDDDSPEEVYSRVKVIFLGAPGVGKTSIIRQFVWNDFTREYKPTQKRETFYPSVILSERLYELKITDIPVIPYFPVDSFLEWTDFRYYGLRSANAYVFVFDLSSRDTFQYIRTLREQIYESRNMSTVPILVVGNKQDKLPRDASGALLTSSKHRDIVNLIKKHWRCAYVECSAKYNCRVVQVFRELMKGIQAVEGKTPTSPAGCGGPSSKSGAGGSSAPSAAEAAAAAAASAAVTANGNNSQGSSHKCILL